MKTLKYCLAALLLSFLSCRSNSEQNTTEKVVVTAAMKNVMWDGELFGKITLDTINNKTGLYGLGPEAYLRGEILINDGNIYTSRVLADSTMVVAKSKNVSAPFFVYTNVKNWKEIQLPDSIVNIADLENYITKVIKGSNQPFAFKLDGQIENAQIHIQNLPKNTKVSSPKEAHQGQVNYMLTDEDVEIVGFYSQNHKGVFTHHDTFLHMHLITKDESKMGHLDMVRLKKMTLYLPQSIL